MPTRFAKQLTQVFRGAVVIGLATRCAAASHSLCSRLDAAHAVGDHRRLGRESALDPTEVRKRSGEAPRTVDRQMQALHMLGVVDVEEVEQEQRSRWHYSLADGINPDCLVPEIYLRGGCRGKEEREDREDRQEGSHMSMYISTN